MSISESIKKMKSKVDKELEREKEQKESDEKLSELINLDKIETIFKEYFKNRSFDKCSQEQWNLNELELVVLQAFARDFKERTEY